MVGQIGDAESPQARGISKGAPRPFTIESRREESEFITSFILRPLDGAPPLPHEPGQHLTLFIDIPGLGRQKRNYTISSAPNGGTYRISVKREPNGTVSKWLHDHGQPGTRMDVAAPSGSFVAPKNTDRPVVMLSAGVGLTPMVAMLEGLVSRDFNAPVRFIHCSRDGRTHAFGAHVRHLADTQKGIETTIFYTRPDGEDAAGRAFDISGRISLDWLAAHTDLSTAEFYVCGPLSFLRTFVPGLAKRGVPPERLHYEFFGPVEDLFGDDAPIPPAMEQRSSADIVKQRPHAITGFSREAIGGAIIDSNADAVIAADAEGTITLWNPGAERIFGFSEEEAFGQSLDIIIPEPFRARHWEGYRETVASGQSRYGAGDLLAVPGLRKDGKRISLEFTIVLMKDEDERVVGMVSTLRDVSARFEEMKTLKKKLAEAEKREP